MILDNRTPQQQQQGLPMVKMAVTKMSNFSVTIRAWAWVRNYSNSFQLRRDAYESVKKRFEKEGIQVPFQRMVVVQQEEGFITKANDNQ